MTKAEFGVLAKAMKAVYASQSFLPDMDAVDVWYEMLKDLEYPQCAAAIKKHMAMSKYPPTIADIREACVASSIRARDWSEGWADVMNAIRRYGYMREAEAIATFDPTTAETVRRIGWETLCVSENISVERASFRTIYQTMEKRAAEDAQLPAQLKGTIASLLDGVNERLLK